MSLLASRRFAPLFATQFLSAVSDNLLKNALALIILFHTAGEGSPSLVTLAGAVFMLPFLLFSATGGEIADRHDKALVARLLKAVEVGAALIAAAGLATSSIPLLFLALFAFGSVSALFGPVKYGILPDHLPTQDLAAANAWIEGATFAAILGGTIGAGLVLSAGVPLWAFGIGIAALSVVTYLASRAIPSAPPASAENTVDANPLRATWRLLRETKADRRIFAVALMSAWFWVVGAIVLSVLPVLVGTTLGGDETVVTLCLAAFAVAVGLGSAFAAWLGKGKIVLLPAPAGCLLMGAATLDLVFRLHGATPNATLGWTTFATSADGVWLLLDLAGIAFGGALVAVPSFAALQAWAAPERRARTVAGANVLSSGLMVLAGGLVAGLQAIGLSAIAVLAILAAGNFLVAAMMLRALPTDPFRDLISIVFRAFHGLEVEGLENLAKAGENPILAVNHTSFLDAALVMTLTDRKPAFAIDRTTAEAWWVRPFLRLVKAMPIDPTKPIGTRTLVRAVQGGDPLVIFPEGRITVTGRLMKIYDGTAMIAEKAGVPIVPVRIEGLERSPFSRLTGRQVRKALFPKVKVTMLEPVSLNVPENLKGRARRAAAGLALHDVMSDMLAETTSIECTVPQAVLAITRERGTGALALEDPVAGQMTYGRLLTAVAVLARRLAGQMEGQMNVGVLLPNAIGTCVTTLALMSAGRIPAMLNFTAGKANVLAACRVAEIRTVLTSRKFIEKAKLGDLAGALSETVELVYLEDVRASIGLVDKLRGVLSRRRPLVARGPDDAAVILFTSGSEGTPKGVVLTHRNIMANVAQAAQRIDFDSSDKVFNVLPMFHAFGLTAGTLLPLVSGVPTYLYPSPLHFRMVPEAVYRSNATIMFGTDTFLTGYARTANPYDFRSLRYVFAGAEPVKESTRRVWAERFGVRLLEGYGVTETAPVIALNTPMHARAGSVGRLMPGVEARLETVPGIEDGGRLHVRGPNVMAGYLKEDRPGILEAPDGGWHDTGDIVSIDAEGFVTIRGRAKRFAKIGGEMISLAAVENAASETWPDVKSCAVSVPDKRRGERIVLATEAKDADKVTLREVARRQGLPEIAMPSQIMSDFAIPLLGTGKVDFVGTRRAVLNALDDPAVAA
ncbi:acyl-[ACP]--phospholipid O-acyltransferase [Aurantimonas sp. VKM B-3413]|uniref:acyl-[ACP]--phospholipid O-acyltransferase n=1 Tax=Aurantimonas sp. VKM B-3413 TaxID=2779401 RepID=UPI001E524E83|nr:acyl-[ACP]--phospholipid O-acyltransferase [Aurantimonas sp. VKM B-3413]MCB8835907.1 acyl-[ACP]--phospholipid O-acyltransferase [Aurantimonas sp. VKM B-3413]